MKPAIGDQKFKIVKNVNGDPLKAFLDDNGKTVVVPGVTTALSQLDSPGIRQWSVDQTAAWAVANVDYLLSCSQEQGYQGLRWYWKRKPDLTNPLRNAHQGVLDDLSELGTRAHEWIQADLGVGEFYPEIDSLEMEQIVDAWNTYKFEHDIRNMQWSERTLWNSTQGYAGTADLRGDIDDEQDILIDIKTSRLVHDKHKAQLSALWHCETEMIELDNGWDEIEFPKPAKVAVLQARPDGYDNDRNFVPRFVKLHVIDSIELPAYYDLFLAALGAAKARRAIKEFSK